MLNKSGQALLITVLITIMLFICIPVVVLVNINRSHNSVSATKRDKALPIAEEGVSYVIQQLLNGGNPSRWDNEASVGNFVNVTGCNTDNDVVGADGGHFRLSCATGTITNQPACQPYQIYVKVTGYVLDASGSVGTQQDNRPGPMAPRRAIAVYLSKKTLSASLSTGFNAPVALRMANLPNVNASGCYNVNWGPILVLDGTADGTAATDWIINDCTNSPITDWPTQMDTRRYPRKFRPASITGTVARSPQPIGTAPSSDQKEYWAWSSFIFPSIVDANSTINSYAKMAEAETENIPMPGGPVTRTSAQCPNANLSCGHFVATGGPAVFGTPGTPYTVPSNKDVIYVEGDALLNEVSLDMRAGGALIVTGQLTLGNKTNGTLSLSNALPVPITAPLEYPYWSEWPLHGTEGTLQSGSTNIYGFVYSGSDLTVQPCGGTPPFWTVTGAMDIGGTLQIGANAGLSLWYDDNVNRAIHTTPFQIQIDTQRDAPI